MTPGQCRSARILLDWTHAELAKRAGTSPSSISRYERGEGISRRLHENLRQAFEAAGIRFEGDWAVCYKDKESPESPRTSRRPVSNS